MSTIGKPSSLVKPTLDTKFHIDYDWWDPKDLRIYLLSHLLPEQRDQLSQNTEDRIVDFIDPDTGEVSQLDELGIAIQLAAQDPSFITPQTAVVDSVFRVFLMNNNTPLSPRELAEYIERPADLILRTLGGRTVYKGIRPSLP